MASSIYGLIQTHPNDPSRPLVDFDVALTFIPALLLGVSFGANFPLQTKSSCLVAHALFEHFPLRLLPALVKRASAPGLHNYLLKHERH